MIKLAMFAILMSFFGSSAYALGTPSFSINEGDNQKGTLSMQELFIGGVKTHDNVKIEFDFKNSTFRLLEIDEADNTIPSLAIETQEVAGVNVGLRGCLSLNRTITCHLLLTSNEFDRTITLCAQGRDFCVKNKSTLFDDLGNQYFATKVTIANNEDDRILEQRLIADIPTDATIVFENLSTRATSISVLDIKFYIDGGQEVIFRDVAF